MAKQLSKKKMQSSLSTRQSIILTGLLAPVAITLVCYMYFSFLPPSSARNQGMNVLSIIGTLFLYATILFLVWTDQHNNLLWAFHWFCLLLGLIGFLIYPHNKQGSALFLFIALSGGLTLLAMADIARKNHAPRWRDDKTAYNLGIRILIYPALFFTLLLLSSVTFFSINTLLKSMSSTIIALLVIEYPIDLWKAWQATKEKLKTDDTCKQ